MISSADRCKDMTELRAEIDRIDRALIALLGERVACIDRAVELKRAEGLPARIDARVAEVLENVRCEAGRKGLDAALAERLWSEMIEWSITREERVLGSGQGRTDA